MIDKIEVCYDGLDAKNHIISASELAESMAGFARIFGTVYHFTTTGVYVKKAPAQDVKIYVTESQARCYSIFFEAWEIARQQQVFQGLIGNIAVAVVTYIVAKAANGQGEMKHLAQALQTALAQNGQRDQAVLDRLLETVDKMADALRPSAKQAVAPIGGSCATVRVGGQSGITLDAQDKANIMAESPVDITTERKWEAVITELDRENATGKARLDGDDDSRVPLTITDPAFKATGSVYLRAFVDAARITLMGKAEMSEGEIKRLYVSDALLP